MATSLRSFRLLVTAACVFLALPLSRLACGQADAAVITQGQDTGPVRPPAGSSDGAGEWVPRPYELHAYEQFFSFIAMEEDGAEVALREGREPYRMSLKKYLFIREDEEQVVRAISVDADHKIKASDAEFRRLNDEIGNGQNHSPELIAAREAAGQAPARILKEAVVKLRQSITPESFEKVESYVFRCAMLPLPSRDSKSQ